MEFCYAPQPHQRRMSPLPHDTGCMSACNEGAAWHSHSTGACTALASLHALKMHSHDIRWHVMLQRPSPCGQKLNQSCCAPSKVDGHDTWFCSSSSLVCLASNGVTARCQTYDKDCGLLGQKACPSL